MGAGDLNWTDAGRVVPAQLFYSKLRGKKAVGKCGDNEVRTGLMVGRLYKIWLKLFRLTHKREPYHYEIHEAITTKKMGRDVARWESVELVPPSERQLLLDVKIRKNLRRQERVLRNSLSEMKRRAAIKEVADKAEIEAYEAELATVRIVPAAASPVKVSAPAKQPIAKQPKETIDKEKFKTLVSSGFSSEVICIALGITEARYSALRAKYNVTS